MPFELIKELTEFSANYRLEKINTLSGNKDSTDKAEELYWLLRKNNELSPTEAAAQMYGPGEAENSNRFQMLKRRLLGKLVNTLFFLDQDSNSLTDLRSGHLKAYREYSLAKMMGLFGQYVGMKYFYQRTFKMAEKFEITDLKYQSGQILRHLASSHEKDLKIYRYYEMACDDALELLNAEAKGKKYHDEILVNYGASPASRRKVAEIADKAMEELAKFSIGEKTATYAFSYYCIKLQGCEAKSDAEGMITTAELAINELKQKPFDVSVSIAQFAFYKIAAFIQLREYTRGMDILDQIQEYLPPHSITWFKFQEFAYLLFAHTGQYAQAYRIYLEVASSKKFNKLSAVMQQIWRLKRAYLYFLQEMGQVDLSTHPDPLGSFRVTTFLNNVPEFSTDKSGMNIPVLVLQILYAIKQRRYDISVERIEAIEKYTTRHVRRDEHYRSNCFIKALTQLPIADFHRAAANRLGTPYIDKLKKEIVNLSGQNYHVEVVPYDYLWPIALNLLENKRVYR